jgi:hypothetical protein
MFKFERLVYFLQLVKNIKHFNFFRIILNELVVPFVATAAKRSYDCDRTDGDVKYARYVLTLNVLC